LGIDLGNDGVTANAPAGTVRVGANTLLNYPVLTKFTHGSAIIEGTYAGPASQTFTLDFYTNDAADPSGNGQGKTWIGSGQVTTDAAGQATFKFTFNVNVPEGQVISATATDSAGNTSEFSGLLQVPPTDRLADTGSNAGVFYLAGVLLITGSIIILGLRRIEFTKFSRR
jgi:LPXTG-motif cell wall-anchored protein